MTSKREQRRGRLPEEGVLQVFRTALPVQSGSTCVFLQSNPSGGVRRSCEERNPVQRPSSHNIEVSMRTLSLIACTVVTLVISSAAQLRCDFKDLQFPQGVTLGVEGISNRGEAVGNYFPPTGAGVHGFYFVDGKFVGISHPNSPATTATGVSDRGVIVGYFQDGVTFRGFRYENGKFMTVNFPHSASTQVFGINEIGQMVGGYTDAQGNQFGFVDRGGSYSKIQFPGASLTTAYGITREGKIVGTYADSSGNEHGFVLSQGHYESIDVPGASETVALGISSTRNWIVGDYVK